MSTPTAPSAETLATAWSALLAQTSEIVLLADGRGRLMAASRPAHQLLGLTASSVGQALRPLLGLPPGGSLEGSVVLAAGMAATLRCTPLPSRRNKRALLIMLELAHGSPATASAIYREQRLREVTLTITSALEIGQILNHVVRLATDLLGATAGALPLYDQGRDVVIPGSVYNLRMPLTGREQYRGTGLIWRVLDAGRPMIINHYDADPEALPDLVAQGIRSIAAAPVRAGGSVLGILILYDQRPTMQFTASDMALLDAVARQAGVAMQNARLYETAVREGNRRALLYKASVELGAVLNIDHLYATIHRAAARLMPCDICLIALLDSARQEIEYVYLADGPRRWPPHRLPLSRGLLGFVARTGVSLRLVHNDNEIERWFGAEPFSDTEEEPSPGALLAVALNVGERTLGAITVQAHAPDAYSSEDLEALEMLASTAAIAIQNAQLFAKVQELATRDALTGVANRRHFFELARSELERAARYGHPVSLLMIDADHFKVINDTYGHLVGDMVLQAIAGRCRNALREADIVARYGGEEFLALLPETSGEQAVQVAERLRDTVAREPVQSAAGPIRVSVSIGIASYERGAVGQIDQLLDYVDQALYQAKSTGRNQVRAYGATDTVSMPEP